MLQNGAFVRVFYLGTKTESVNAGDITLTLACGDGIDDPSQPYSGSNSAAALSVMYLRAEPFRHGTSFGVAWVDGHSSLEKVYTIMQGKDSAVNAAVRDANAFRYYHFRNK